MYYTIGHEFGLDIRDVLYHAIEVQIGSVWYFVLGYDIIEDVLSVAGSGNLHRDFNVQNASKQFTHEQIRVSRDVQKT